jgi:hypothetical protein
MSWRIWEEVMLPKTSEPFLTRILAGGPASRTTSKYSPVLIVGTTLGSGELTFVTSLRAQGSFGGIDPPFPPELGFPTGIADGLQSPPPPPPPPPDMISPFAYLVQL